MIDITFADIFNRDVITNRAKDNWNYKSEKDRIRASNKYKHFMKNHFIRNWKNDFDDLSIFQKYILIKGELIRTYDSLPNCDKRTIKRNLSLTKFSYKWYKLDKEDKKKILNAII